MFISTVKDKIYKYTNSFVNFISNESVQKYLKRINLVFCLFCLLFIAPYTAIVIKIDEITIKSIFDILLNYGI